MLLAAGAASEATLLIVLVQLCLIIAAARVFGALFRRFHQPIVVGEILAGLILGPSVLGRLAPQVFATVFPKEPAIVGESLHLLSQIGLIFLLFIIGLEFDFSHLQRYLRASLLISLAGIVAPFGLGYVLAGYVHPLAAPAVNATAFGLFMGTAMSITAIPILGRIMMELGISRSRLGAITIAAAAADDACGWILLATVSAIVRSQFNPAGTALMLAEAVAFAAFMIYGAGPLLRRFMKRALERGQGHLSLDSLAVLFIAMFLCAMTTGLIGIFAIFGAFLLGASLSKEHELREAVGRQLAPFVTAFFLPIFFTHTGLRTRVDSLDSAALWGAALAVCAVAIIGKFGGCLLAARSGGLGWRESACVGVMMNTRALMELIVINVGHDLGIIPPPVYCMLVMMAVLTTVMTTPILLRLKRGTELEPMVARSAFMDRSRAVAARASAG